MRMWHLLKGDIPYHDRALHDEYGPVVRMSPSYVSFNTSQATQGAYVLLITDQSAEQKKTYTVGEKETRA
jgi:hypothetical protein